MSSVSKKQAAAVAASPLPGLGKPLGPQVVDYVREFALTLPEPSELEPTEPTVVSPPTSVQPASRPRPKPRYAGAADIALARAALEAATTSAERRRLKRRRGLAVIIQVPSESWAGAFKHYLQRLIAHEFSTVVRTGAAKTQENPSHGNDDVATSLAAGTTVIGISQTPASLLPRVLTAAADITIIIKQPTGAVIKQAMRWTLRGRIPGEIDHLATVGLDLHDIVGALRSGSSASQAFDRLVAVANTRGGAVPTEGLPTIEETASGPAREWALELRRDVALARQTGDFSGLTKGVCLFGPPGSGKTYFGRVVAHACGLPLVVASVSEFFASSSGYLDGVIKAQREAFNRAGALATAAGVPALLLWDELDALPSREKLSPRGRDWWTPVITDALLLCDSAVSSGRSGAGPGIIVVGCTNRIEDVEPALLRPGRLERAVEVPPPDVDGLARIVRHHLGGDLRDLDLVSLSRLGAGATAADAAEWVRTARRRARFENRALTAADIEEVIAPPEMRDPDVLRRAAVHEAGHAVALVAMADRGAALTHVSLIKKGASGGHTKVQGDGAFLTSADIDRRIVGLLAARAAEALILGQPASGAQEDLAMATRLATAKVSTFGLGGALTFREEADDVQKTLLYDSALRETVEQDLQRLYRRAEDLIAAHRGAVEAVADALAGKRFLTAEETKEIVARHSPRIPGAARNDAEAGGV